VDTPRIGQYGGKNVKNDQFGENVDLEQEDMKLGAEIDADMGEFQDQVWRDKTKKTRARLTVRSKQKRVKQILTYCRPM
jgi:hypothetical protein